MATKHLYCLLLAGRSMDLLSEQKLLAAAVPCVLPICDRRCNHRKALPAKKESSSKWTIWQKKCLHEQHPI